MRLGPTMALQASLLTTNRLARNLSDMSVFATHFGSHWFTRQR